MVSAPFALAVACEQPTPIDPKEKKLNEAQAKLDSLHEKFRIDIENAKYKPENMSDSFNSGFRQWGGEEAKDIVDSVPVGKISAEHWLKEDGGLGILNVENMKALLQTSNEAIAQKSIVDNLQKNM
jgi:hypothetical protein